MAACSLHIGGLVKDAIVKGKRLVAADHPAFGMAFRNVHCLGFRKNERDVLGASACSLQRCFQRPLVHARLYDPQGEPSVFEKLPAEGAGGGEDEGCVLL